MQLKHILFAIGISLLGFLPAMATDYPSPTNRNITVLGATEVNTVHGSGPQAFDISGPADVTQTVGTRYTITNTGPQAAYGERFAYLSYAQGAGSFDLAKGIIMFDRTDDSNGLATQDTWHVHVCPNNNVHNWTCISSEINVVNRGDDKGYSNVPTGNRFVGGTWFVPEAQLFGEPGHARNVDFAWGVAPSGGNNDLGKQVKSYNGFVVYPNAIAPNGRGVELVGSVSGPSGDYPALPIGIEGNWLNGIDTTAATFTGGNAMLMAPGQVINWTNGTGTAALQGSCLGGTCNLIVAASGGAISPSGSVSLGSPTSPWANLYMASNAIQVAPFFTPASSSAACTKGQVANDAGFTYVCTATNTWKRAALSTF